MCKIAFKLATLGLVRKMSSTVQIPRTKPTLREWQRRVEILLSRCLCSLLRRRSLGSSRNIPPPRSWGRNIAWRAQRASAQEANVSGSAGLEFFLHEMWNSEPDFLLAGYVDLLSLTNDESSWTCHLLLEDST